MGGWARLSKRLVPKSLSARFTLLVGLILLILTTLFVVFSALDVERNAQAMLDRRVDDLLAVVSAPDSELAPGDRIADIRGVIENMARSPSVLYGFAYLVDAQGKPTDISPEPLVRDRAAADAFAQARQSEGPVMVREHETVHVAIPVMHDGQVAGVVRVGFSTLSMNDIAAAAIGRNVIVALLFFGSALILVAFAVTRFMAPMRSLAEAAGQPEGHIGADHAAREDELGELARAFARMTDALSESAATVERLTFTDRMSGLANRDQLRVEVEAALDEGHDVYFLYLNIDRLKRVNEGLGIDVGDGVIQAVGTRLHEALDEYTSAIPARSFEVRVGRLGGDEFGVVLSGILSEEETGRIARSIVGGFAKPLPVLGQDVTLTVSVGIASAPNDGLDFNALLRAAGCGLREAKAAGRNTYRFSRRDVHSYAYRRLRMEQELTSALQKGELEVFFQPQIALKNNRLIGAEGLLRWRHPERGLVTPGDFIDLVEEAGLMDQIGAFVLRSVCTRGADWAARGLACRLAVNVSASQCQRSDFPDEVLAILTETGMNPRNLELEITESVAMTDPRQTALELAALRKAGLRIAVDDFGTGYSNLASLTRMPFDVLKIDRSFVSESARDGAARVVVATILSLAQSLGFETVAEGVETDVQRSFLLGQRCTYGQGFLFGKPMPAEEFEDMLVESRAAEEALAHQRSRA